jgi:hypothetical protein
MTTLKTKSTIKFTKTEQKVLESASRSYRGEITTHQSQGVVSRELQAARSLQAKGLMVFVDEGWLEEFSFRAGRETVYHVTRHQITAAGRKVLKTLS